MTYGPVDRLAADPRYTDLATVKNRLRLPDSNTDFDDRITTAIVSAEIGIDLELGRSFPDIGAVPGIAGTWLLEAGTVAPPSDGTIRHDGDTTLWVAEVDVYGNHYGPPTDQAIDLNYVYLSQPGERRVHLKLSSPVDGDDYWQFTTEVESGSWTDIAFLEDGAVKLSFFEGLAIPGIPVPVVNAATSVAMAIYKNQDAPTGSAGSDSFVGELDVEQLVRSAIARSPELRGFRKGPGFGIA